jgi:uncharacterized protein YutE (UPF0331/DUF86 family)
MTSGDIGAKLQALRHNLERLQQVPQRTFEEFSSDHRNVASAIYYLQTSIQALIDLASWLVARLAVGVPRRSLDVFELLEGAGRLPAGTTKRMTAIIGFRNRVVHLYDRVDERIVYDIVAQHSGDLTDVLDLLLSIEAGEAGSESGA